jgi:site-specific DNA-methyltransferase (adenine-specific)
MQTIIQGDCIEKMQELPAESVDVAVTSPPYNIGKDYKTYSDDLPHEAYLGWMEQVFVQIHRLLKPDGSFFLNIGSTCKEPHVATDVCREATKHFVLQNNIVWVKSISVLDEADWRSYGHFKPIVSGRFLNQTHESIYHFTKNGDLKIDRLAIGVPYQDKSNIDRWKHEGKVKSDKRCRGNVWFIPYETVQSKKQHTAGFPVKLPEYCISLHGVRDGLVVLDPFLGAGTTLRACENLGVTGIGIELDQFYCDLAKDNLLLS